MVYPSFEYPDIPNWIIGISQRGILSVMPTGGVSTPSRLNDVVEELLGSTSMLLEAHRVRATLILVYAGMDILGALDTEDGTATRGSFIRWADTYMAPSTKLGCSAVDLYSARCGVLHTLSPETGLTKGGKAREFAYVTYPPFFPEENAPTGPFLVHVPTLWLAFRDGTAQFEADATADPRRAEHVERNLAKLYFTRTQ
jgi:hypothetical protein